ncbi:sugar phosphate nucleotidyltransferase [Planococcus ruber]|uniref:sugar phosphate nucleotidyltransferase n=1 Tax=Planococcus ruber TaxID=2027871 RepID=UPI001FEE78CD|nr:sugar phosphate nucleotidyltransferase [Planococcus ruber]MCJ1909632.1 sugar phosphate nucleotidyltransferase [Planococcus ruber]
MRLMAVIDASVRMSGLEDLTMYRSTASIPFSGRYRLIDFALSNVVNSNINLVGVFPAYPFVSLLDHIGVGKSWDLNRRKDGLFFLPGSQKVGNYVSVGAFSMLGEHRSFFVKSRQEHVVITNCFTVAQLDFEEMLDVHLTSGKDITEAICEDGTHLKSYILSKKLLLELMESYEEKKVISIEDVVNRKKAPYTFNTYTHDGFVAVIDSTENYFRSAMSLLEAGQREKLYLKDRPIYTKVKDEPPTKHLKGSQVSQALIGNGCTIAGSVKKSIISRAVSIQEGARLENCIIMQKSKIGKNCELTCVIADKDVEIDDGVVLKGTWQQPIVLRKGERVTKEDVQ